MATIRAIEVSARNLVIGQTELLTFATGGFMSAPGDTPPNTWYDDCVLTSLNFERSLFGQRQIWGQSAVGRGVLKLSNPNGELDNLARYSFDGARLVVREGEDPISLADMAVVFTGCCESQEMAMDTVTLNLRDRLADLDKPVQSNTYAGTDEGPIGVEGKDSLAGKRKPLCIGHCLGVPVTMVNASSLIGQVHDGPVAAITNPRDKAYPLTSGADYPTLAALAAADVPAGHVATCLATGHVKFGVTPAGDVTVDVQGCKKEGVYVETTAGCLRRLFVGYAGIPVEDIDQQAFAALEADAPQVVGIYIDDDTTVLDAADFICSGVLAWYDPGLLGKFTCGLIALPQGPGVAVIDELYLDQRLERQAAKHTDNGLPAWKVTVQYGRLWHVIAKSSMAGGVSADDQVRYASGWLSASAENNLVQAAYPHAQDVTLETSLVNVADAQALAERYLALVSVRRDFWVANVPPSQAVGVDLGQVVTLQQARMGLDDGQSFLVTGLVQNYGAGAVTLTLWGWDGIA
jgi:hypothetical protein